MMLQQTQVQRVIPKFEAFLAQFPDVATLADAERREVLIAWQGLGYNRRAKYLHDAAQCIQTQNSFPRSLHELVQLPGIGPNTAGAIMAYAWNERVVFIETNIRTVLFYHFFEDAQDVTDAELRCVLEQVLVDESPREFYWAMMDYGSWLKSKVKNNSQSKHYTKQSTFKGSRRQVRGQILKQLTAGRYTCEELQAKLSDERLKSVLTELVKEGLVYRTGKIYHL